MLSRLLLLISDTVCGFFSFVLVARFALQAVRASYRNPVAHFVVAVTDWMLRPARRVIPGLRGHDLPSLALAAAWQALHLGLTLVLTGVGLAAAPAPAFAFLALVVLEVGRIALWVGFGAVIVAAIFSWVNPYAPGAAVFEALSRPLLAPLRRRIPPVGGIDLSPLVLLLAMQIGFFLLDSVRVALMPLLRG